MTTFSPSDRSKEAASEIVRKAGDAFSPFGELPTGNRQKDMPGTSYAFLAALIRLQRATAYDVYRLVKEMDSQVGGFSTLPLQSAYRAAGWLLDRGYIFEDGVESSTTNGISKTFFVVSQRGAEAFGHQARKHLLLSLAWAESGQ